MNKYIGTKFVDAEPQTRTVVTYEGKTLVAPENTEDLCVWTQANHIDPKYATIQNNVPGYKVVYPDGYVSWSPKEVFEAAYRLISHNMTFSDALVAMKAGMIVTRTRWIGRTVCMRNGYHQITLNDDTCRAFKIPKGTTANVKPYLQIRQGDALQVYIPTMDDLMANDWCWVSTDPGDKESADE